MSCNLLLGKANGNCVAPVTFIVSCMTGKLASRLLLRLNYIQTHDRLHGEVRVIESGKVSVAGNI